jgi:pyridoxine/pyridoxamine 5'-phosphate oxidase
MSAKGSKKSAGQSLKSTIVSTRRVLEDSVDKQMLKFRQSQPDFFQSYQAARVTVDNPGGHKSKNGNGNVTPPQ